MAKERIQEDYQSSLDLQMTELDNQLPVLPRQKKSDRFHHYKNLCFSLHMLGLCIVELFKLFSLKER
jgi:hypothetical protein